MIASRQTYGVLDSKTLMHKLLKSRQMHRVYRRNSHKGMDDRRPKAITNCYQSVSLAEPNKKCKDVLEVEINF